MSIVAWILLGLNAGLLAGQIVSLARVGLVFRVLSGESLAVLGGAVAHRLAGALVVTRLDFWSMCFAMTAAVVLLAMHHDFMAKHTAKGARCVRKVVDPRPG
jgi:uncharacterized membrane protein YeaQ/YmgE (transglycosylase-associated protein family)